MATWVLSLMMVVSVQVAHPGDGESMSQHSASSTVKGFPSQDACEAEGKRWRDKVLRRQPGAVAIYSCRRDDG